MMKILKSFRERMDRGQSMLEFAALLIVVIGALIVAQVYFKRGIQGRWKSAADQVSDQLYDPLLTDSNITYGTVSNSDVEITTTDSGGGVWTTRTDNTNTIDSRTGKTTVGGYN